MRRYSESKRRYGTTQSRPSSFFFFNDTATTEIYTLSLHDALPISISVPAVVRGGLAAIPWILAMPKSMRDRKSTRLNSSHSQISYAVFCLKKKKTQHNMRIQRHVVSCSRTTPYCDAVNIIVSNIRT